MASKEAGSLLAAAEGLLDQDEFAQALELAKKASKLLEKDANMQGLADATRIIVSAHCGLQERKVANEVATEMLAKFKGKEGWQCEEAKMLLSVAEVNYDKRGSKNRELAMQSALEALRIFKEKGIKELEAATLLTLGNISLKDRKSHQEQTGRQALSYAKQAGQLFHKLGDQKRKALAAHNVATAHLVLKDQNSAIAAANEALRLFRELGDKKLEAFELQCIASWQAEFQTAAGYEVKPSTVIPVAKEALEASRKIESADGRAIEASMLASLVKLQAKYSPEEARTLAKQGVRKFRDLEDKQAEAISLMALAGVSYSDDTTEAVNAASRAKAAYKSVGDASGQSKAHRILSELDLMLNRSDSARDMAEMAIKNAEKVKDPRALATSIFAVARVHLLRNEVDACIEYAREARNLCATVKWMQGEAESLVLIVRAEMMQKHYEEAKGPLQEAVQLMQMAGEEVAVCKLMLMTTELHFLLEEWDDAEKLGGALAFYGNKLGNQGIGVTAQLVMARVAVKKLQLDIEQNPENLKQENPAIHITKAICNQALKSARLSRQAEAVCQAQVLMAQIYMLETAFGSSIEIALGASIEAQKLAKKAGDIRCRSTALMLSANAHSFLKEMDAAWYAAETAQRLFSDIGDSKGAMEAAGLLEKLAPHWKKKEEKKPEMPPQFGLDAADMAAMVPAAAAAPVMKTDLSDREAVDISLGVSLELVVDRMRFILEDNLGLNVDDIENDAPLMQSGVTSGGSVLLTGALGADFPKVKLPATLAFDYPSINSVSGFILDALQNAGVD